MKTKLQKFLRSERGAVTVDWVVITAAVVSLAGLVMIAITNGTDSVGDSLGGWLSSRQVGS